MFRARLFSYEPHCLAILVFVLATGVIWIRTATVKFTYHYVNQEKELIRAQQEVQAIKLKWLKLTSPRRLETVAKALNLHPPTIHQTLKFKTEKLALNK